MDRVAVTFCRYYSLQSVSLLLMWSSVLPCLATLLFMSGVATGQTTTWSTGGTIAETPTLPATTGGGILTTTPPPTNTTTVPAPFFAVGPGATPGPNSDGGYVTIQLPQPFNYGGNTYNQLYLSMDGYVSFSVPNTDDEYPNPRLGKDVIAALWTDLDSDSGGNWTYELATYGSLINQANQEINRMFPYRYFSASWVFVSTWENVPLELSGSQASLQLVLASDGGSQSFIIMNYGRIPSIPSRYWLAGYDFVGRDFITIPVNDTSELSSSSNVNIRGRYAYLVTVPAPFFAVGPGATPGPNSDGGYVTIQLPQPFNYGGNTYNQLYLSMDGYVSFSVPNTDDEYPNPRLGKDVIAALWTDLDSDSGGNWTYELATYGSLINQANQEINRMFPYLYFSASWVFVSTWENVPLEFSGFQGASLQLVLASDGGSQSFIIMNYGRIPSIPSRYWLAGYDFVGRDFITIPVNDTSELSSSSNVNIRGRYAYLLTVPAPFFAVGPGATPGPNSDGGYVTIQLPQPFNYGGNTYNQLYLSMDGYVSFSVPNTDDEYPNPRLGKDVIAALWTDLDSDSGGNWTYELATYGSLINQANQEINRMFPYLYFSASWVFVSTWENVPLELSGSQASLQLVLASDGGSQSFIIMNYGRIPSIPSRYWLAGYDFVGRDFITIPVNDTSELSSSSNVNIRGRYAYLLTVPAPFFAVGPGATPGPNSDGGYVTIQLPQPFNYGGNTYNQLYLSMDGYVSFSVPNTDDEYPNPRLGKDVIAALWTDLDSDSGGNWTYELATYGSLINQANQEINRMFPYRYFSASWVFVSTWENVPLELSGSQASLQLVLASDGGSQSFIIMNYGRIPSIPSRYWLAGYDFVGRDFITVPVNDTSELSSSSNVNIRGRYAYLVTVPAPFFAVGPGATPGPNSDGGYVTIQLPQPFNYGGNTYNQLYLSMDGYVSFSVPNTDDEYPNPRLGKDVIAALWTDLDSDSGGNWTYELATYGSLINQANQEINRMFPYLYFSASWVFVSTWENVPLEFSGFQGASLQLVLASDGGSQSFIIMNYGRIPSIPSRYWLAGYDFVGRDFITIPVNDTSELSSSSNVNIRGRYAYLLTVPAPFFAVGPGATPGPNSDGGYVTIQLPQPFNYGGNTYNQLYLSMDGYVSFSVPNTDDEYPNPRLGKDVIAALWTDLDSDSGGNWTYELATYGSLINQANQEINRMFPYLYFSASWVFVSTWENVPLEFSGFQGASLQLVLASDGGSQSFIIMNYGRIPSIPSRYWLAGYDFVGRDFITIPVNDTSELSSSSNVNIRGRYAYLLTVPAPFFAVGPGATPGPNSDGGYVTIQLPQPFNYGGNTYNQLYLSMDGYVSFSVPNTDDEYPNPRLGKDVIAALWTDLDSDSGGNWTYELATYGSLINQANQEINRMFPYRYFSASWVFVSTWENVPLEFSGFQGASLQLVLASDGGSQSFIIMNYGRIPSIPSRYWLAGYDFVGRDFITIPVNDTSELSSSSNVNIRGRYAYLVTVPAPFFAVGPGATPGPNSDGGYVTIQLPQPFNYGGNTYNQLYLSMDGYVSFSVPNTDDEYPNPRLGKDVIAALWTDLDSDSGGNWTYELATYGSLINQANQEINRMFPYLYFSASWVFVSTWENVPLEFSGFQGASLQLVLASDGGSQSFIIMNYGRIPSIPSRYWLAGYDFVGRDFITIPVNDTSELSSSSNVNIRGRYAYLLTGQCSAQNCTQNEVCSLINGTYGCACGYTSTPSLNFDAIETCSGSVGSLSLSRCQLFESGYSADVLHLNNQTCKGELQHDRLVFSFDSNANLCGTTLENNRTHIIFKNNVGTIDGISVISRTGGLNIAFSCVYPIIQSISMPMAVEAIESTVSRSLSTEGSYQISMIPYTDDTFLVPFIGNVTLEVNHQLYIAVNVDTFDSSQIALVLDNCWATPVNQSDYSIRWDLIINECPNSNDNTVAVLQNGVSTSSRFSFRMFTFTGVPSSKIYLHCQVHLCLAQQTSCALPCTGKRSRRRRSVDFYDSAGISMGI